MLWIKQVIKTADKIKNKAPSQIKQLINQTGIYIFFVSLMLFTQTSWIKQHQRYSEIEVRLFLSFLIGIILSFSLIKLIKKIEGKTGKKQEAFLNNISIALSPGILFIFASTHKIFLVMGTAFCVFTALYVWVKPFRNIINSIIYLDKFTNILIIKDDQAEIEVKGIYEKANPKTMQSFLIDLVINFYECSELQIEKIKIDFSRLKDTGRNELKSIIEPIAEYFNLKVIF